MSVGGPRIGPPCKNCGGIKEFFIKSGRIQCYHCGKSKTGMGIKIPAPSEGKDLIEKKNK
jgi:hypothetical protein